MLSGNFERPENLKIDIMKYKFSKREVPPVKIETEYQNAEEVRIDCVSDEEVAEQHSHDYDSPSSQLTYKADIRIAKDRILES